MVSDADFVDLKDRFKALEDRAAIMDLLSGLAISSDTADKAVQQQTYHEECVMDPAPGIAPVVGQEAIVGLLDFPAHFAARLAGMVHFAGLPQITIQGDRAVAIGYLQIIVPLRDGPSVAPEAYPADAGLAIWRLTANRWDLACESGQWRIIRRTIRSLPDAEARKIMSVSSQTQSIRPNK